MRASRSGERGWASATAAGACQERTDTTGGRSFSLCRTSGVMTPTATAPHASRRRTRVLRKAAGAYPPGTPPRLICVPLFRAMDDSEPVRPGTGTHEQEHRAARATLLDVGTLACSRCDAPVALTEGPMSPA